MSTSGSRAPGDCEACEERTLERTALYNRPGQPALTYRIGTHGSFFQRMVSRLAREALPDGDSQGERPLAALSTRGVEDPAIALLDAWAIAADVLTFYQERIANEGFLRTATERRSLLELAREMGYEPRPGVAASTHLAFTVDTAPGAPSRVQVGRGVQVLSIPGQDERPQTFETLEPLEARAAWNDLRPRRTQAQQLGPGDTTLRLAGLQTSIQRGDALLLVGEERESDTGSKRWDVRQVQSVDRVTDREDPARSYTVVTWEPGLDTGNWQRMASSEVARAYVLRLRGNLFGYNAPDFRTLSEDLKKLFNPAYNPGAPDTHRFAGFEIRTADEKRIDLDREYPSILIGSWVVLWTSGDTALYRVEDHQPFARVDFALTGNVSRLTLDTGERLKGFPLRGTVVLAQSEELPLAEVPLEPTLAGDSVELDRVVEELPDGRRMMVEGRPLDPTVADSDGLVREPVVLERASRQGAYTLLRFQKPLTHELDRTTVRIYANVVPSTHGETVKEVLGGGDGSRTHQRFTLRRPPLTYVPAATETGGQSTLEIWVNGVRWTEVPTLYGQGPRDEVYMVRQQADGSVTVQFGDAVSGARLPTGQENVAAVYRSGIGPEGEVDRGQLALLKVRPLGIREVVNPLPATGAAAPESRDDIRANAPSTVLTLGRVVSLQDYEDFAATFAGIGKARASDLSSGERPLVHITVAAPGARTVEPGSALYESLVAALTALKDPVRQFTVESFEPITFELEARLRVDARRRFEDVRAGVTRALRSAFSFERRGFGQAVSAAEVIRVMQEVEGVVMVDLERLRFRAAPEDSADNPELASVLPARGARWDRKKTRILRAELLLLDGADEALDLKEDRP